MVYLLGGIDLILDFLAAGSTTRATHIFYGEDAADLINTLTRADMDGDYARSTITFTLSGQSVLMESTLLSTSANGSYIDRLGTISSGTVGAGTLVTVDESAIGSKNDSFEVSVSGETVLEEA